MASLTVCKVPIDIVEFFQYKCLGKVKKKKKMGSCTRKDDGNEREVPYDGTFECVGKRI